MLFFPPEIISHTTESHFVENSTKTRVIYILTVIFIILLFVALPFVSVNVTTQTRGIIRTQSENTLLQTAVYGEVKRINITENKKVKQGDILLRLNTDKIDEQLAEYKNDLYDNNEFIKDLSSLLVNNPKLQTAKYQREFAQYTSKIEEFNIQLLMVKKEFELKKILFEKSVVAEIEYLQEKNKYDVALSRKNYIIKQYQNQWQAEITRLQQLNKDIYLEIAQIKKEKQLYTVTAPVSGVITNVAGIKQGSFLVPNQQIALIAGSDSILIECYVSPADIGFIKSGQAVKFQIDAFNYNQWGMAEGSVKEISTDVYNINEQVVFKVRCSLNTDYLQLKNGYKGYLKKGMTLTTRFYLTRRTLWQLLFDKVDNWINPKLITS